MFSRFNEVTKKHTCNCVGVHEYKHFVEMIVTCRKTGKIMKMSFFVTSSVIEITSGKRWVE